MLGRHSMRRYPYFPRAHVAALALLGALAPVAPAGAWAAQGHRIIGYVAESMLDARTRAMLRRIAGDESLATAGLWMDRERERLAAQWPGSQRWHFDNRPVCDPAVPLDDYCADDNCATRAYARALARLADFRVAGPERLAALRVVVHVLGDLHQPLHAADNGDRGGNAILVRGGPRSRPRPLHATWDADFVKRALRGESEASFARRLVETHRAERPAIEAGNLAAWTAESYELARSDAYGQLPGFACGTAVRGPIALPPEYSDAAARIVEERLARAGVRLAAVLRAALVGEPLLTSSGRR